MRNAHAAACNFLPTAEKNQMYVLRLKKRSGFDVSVVKNGLFHDENVIISIL